MARAFGDAGRSHRAGGEGGQAGLVQLVDTAREGQADGLQFRQQLLVEPWQVDGEFGHRREIGDRVVRGVGRKGDFDRVVADPGAAAVGRRIDPAVAVAGRNYGNAGGGGEHPVPMPLFQIEFLGLHAKGFLLLYRWPPDTCA